MRFGFGLNRARKKGSWTPNDLSGLKLWLDIPDNGSVSNWMDKSINGNNFTQSIASSQPALLSGMGSTSQNYLSFDGVDDKLQFTGNIIPVSNAGMFATVVRYDNSTAASCTFQSFGNSSQVFVIGFISASNAVYIQHTNGSAIDRWQSPSGSVSTGNDYIIKVWSDGTQLKCTINGIEQTLTKTLTGSADTFSWFSSVTAVSYQIGSSGTGYFKSNFGSVILTDSAPTADELTQTENYLNSIF